jgi:hypothetical protein
MACYECPARLPVGQGLDPNQATNRDVQTKDRKRIPEKRNDEFSSKSQKKTTGGARKPSNRSARDSVQAHGLTCDISKSVPRKELTMADDLLMIIPLNSQKNLQPHRPCQVLHPTTSTPMMKAICQVHHPKTSAPMTNAIKMKRVITMLHQKFRQPKT